MERNWFPEAEDANGALRVPSSPLYVRFGKASCHLEVLTFGSPVVSIETYYLDFFFPPVSFISIAYGFILIWLVLMVIHDF